MKTRDTREIVREEPLMRARILRLLEEGPRTVPEIAEAIGYPDREVMFWIMGMRRSGYVTEEGPAEKGFFHYQPTGRKAS